MFLFKQKKGKKKLRTQASIEILDRLNGYLANTTLRSTSTRPCPPFQHSIMSATGTGTI